MKSKCMSPMTWFALFLALFLVSGCSSWFGSKDEEKVVLNEAPPKPKLREVRREPGSLWTDDSRWNDLYSVVPSRILGDILKIKINEELKGKLARLVEPQKTIGASKESLAQAALETKALGNEDPRTKTPEAEYLEASITEVLPRGVFAVVARQVVRLGNVQTRVELAGNVREKDIAQDDTVQSDTILNLNVATNVVPGEFKPGDAIDRKVAESADQAITGAKQ